MRRTYDIPAATHKGWEKISITNRSNSRGISWCIKHKSEGRFCTLFPYYGIMFENEADAIWFALQGF